MHPRKPMKSEAVASVHQTTEVFIGTEDTVRCLECLRGLRRTVMDMGTYRYRHLFRIRTGLKVEYLSR
ncbi:hypothetical protein E2C01_063503 [Portunus trituberculatus]|uniref:Uncharacterized protein n=1 Tax=Portunus trituberculatus TaxID=210409 RepID=A0A5B7HIB9_PORTR|nr:hypothetical protein [Portunus trituberculatus]